ncbi:unnamed protein product [Vicia faba]|uniref:PPC domain-containing protein n=1 Tax=Vicia faba TaxID=3906 RepID=A0AAV0ZQK0_VICFA|nr:unnamed protein product [Vicia faba]
MSNHDEERNHELHPFTTPQLQLNTSNTNTTTQNHHPTPSSTIARRPRGRPPGSKNKPKIPAMVTHDIPNALTSHALEITTGADVLKSLFDYTRRKGKGIYILGGNGVVRYIRLRQPTGKVLTLKGRIQIHSISGMIFSPPTSRAAGGLTVYLSGPKGHMIGGSVMSPMVASNSITLMAFSFANITYEKISSVA